jgi:hypothetical protein
MPRVLECLTCHQSRGTGQPREVNEYMKTSTTKNQIRPRPIVLLLLCGLIALQSLKATFAITVNDLADINRSAPAYDSRGTDLGESGGACTINPSGPNSETGDAGNSLPIRVPVINDPKKLAETIDKYIRDSFPSSPLNGLGKYFVEGGMRAGINPLLAVAQARHESGFATAANGWHKTNPPSYNPFGRSASTSQPHTLYNGKRLVYKYESWQKGLYADAFPADGSTSQPDDWFQYIARRYSDMLDNLPAFINTYAPAFENDVDGYLNAIGKYAFEVAELSEGAIDMTRLGSSSSGTGSCSGGGGSSGDLAALTKGYAWPEYKGKPYREMMPEYKAAVEKAKAAGEYIGGTTYPGVDCGGFVTRLLVNSGFDPTYNHSAKGGYTGIQLQWVRNNWTKIGKGSEISTAQLQPGDVAFQVTSSGANDGHTFVFVGTIEGFDSQIASASLDQRAPMAGRESILANNIEWYRKK